MSIFDVEYQPRAHRIIQRSLMSQRMPHAYLFAGPEGVGREMLASRLAQVRLCESPVRRPLPTEIADAVAGGEGLDACGQCQECRLVEAGTHPDLFIIYRQLNRQHPDATIRKQKALFLGVEVIRHFVVDKVALRSHQGRAKVFIIREAERLNDAAQNCLLKTLEEPPPDTFLILITAAMDHMLPTTRSRCQPVIFQTLPAEYIAERLSVLRPKAGAEQRRYIAAHAGGSLGQALRNLDDGLVDLKRTWGDRLLELIDSGPGFAPHSLARPLMEDAKTLGKLAAQRDPDMSDTDATRLGVRTLLALMADFYLDAQRRAAGVDLPLINADQADVVERLVEGRDSQAFTADLRHLHQAEANLGRNAHTELTLESLMIQLARPLLAGTGRPAA